MKVVVMPDPTQREEAIFQAAVHLETPHERAAFVQRECGGDHLLHQRVTSLLQAHDRAGAFLSRPLSGFRIAAAAAGVEIAASAPKSESTPPTEKAGDRIGRTNYCNGLAKVAAGSFTWRNRRNPCA